MRPSILQHENVRGRHIEGWIVNARGKIVQRGERHYTTLMLEELRIGRRALENGATRGEIAEQSDQAALRFERLITRGDDRLLESGRSGGCKAFAKHLAGDSQTIEVQKRLELAQQHCHSARAKEILHVAVADRLQI